MQTRPTFVSLACQELLKHKDIMYKLHSDLQQQSYFLNSGYLL